jgi:peptide/nickel transport system permease protein
MGNDSAYPLGADSLGRDVRYRILASTRLTLLIAGLATIISTIAGTIAGLAAGFLGGRTDALLSRVVDIFLAFPTLLLILALIASVGQSSWAVIGVLALSGWAGYARVIRSATLTQSRREFIEAARCLGATNGQILTRHLLPNIMTPILVLSTLNLASFVLTESAISYLGLGPAPPETTWGGLIGEGRTSIYDAWWVSVFPGIAIVITVMCFGFVGDAVRDAFDPLSHQQGGAAERGAA